MKRHLSRLAVALLICFLATLAYFPLSRTRAAEKTTPIAFNASGKPFLNTQAARSVVVKYTGEASAVAAMQSGAVARSLIAVDLDMDGAPDLIAGYKTGNGGAVAVTRGNPDAFAPRDPKILQQALKGKVPTAFLSKSIAFSVPEAPDYLAAADFTHHGRRDLLTATRGGGMYLLVGDGASHFSAARKIKLPGDVSAFAANSAGQVAVSVQSGGNAQLLIFDAQSKSGLKSPVATYSLAGPASAVEWGRLGYNSLDLAVASGSSVVVYYNALSKNPKSDTITLSFRPQSIAIGEFTWDRDNRSEIAALAEDGSVHILEHGTLDTRPTRRTDGPARRAKAIAMGKARNLDPTTIGTWKDARNMPATSGLTDGVAPQSLLRVLRTLPGTLLATDGSSRRMNVLGGTAASTTISLSASPVASVDLPAMADGRPAMAVLTNQLSSFSIVPLSPITYNVTTTNDEDDIGACSGSVTSGPGPDGVLSLREAICEANNAGAGVQTINLPAGGYKLTLGELQVGGSTAAGSYIIVGAGAGTTLIQQTDGSNRVIEQDFPFVGGHPVTIQNVTLTGGNCSSGTDCTYGGGAILGTGTTGDDLTLTNVVIANSTAASGVGGGVNTSSIGNFTVTNSAFSGNTTTWGAGGAFQFVPDPSAGALDVKGSIFTGNSVTDGSGPSAAGGAILVYPNTGNSATIANSTFIGNSATATGEADGGAVAANGAVTMSNSRIVGNTLSGSPTNGTGWYHSGGGAGDVATLVDNWWGCNAGPNHAGCDGVAALTGSTANFNPWLLLTVTASPTEILPSQTSSVQANLTTDSNGGTGFTVPDTTPIAVGGTLGTNDTAGGGLTSGIFNFTYTAGSTPGHGSASATVDNQTVSATIEIDDTVSFDTNPTGLIYHVDGTQYSGPQTFHWIVGSTHPVVADSPQAAVGTTQYDFNNWSDGGAASHNISAPTADTSYTASFDLSPAITSGNSVQFVENIKGTFTVTGTGSPAPTFSETGTLPSGITLAADGTLSGTPADGSAGVYPITITATNGAPPDATQSFTITVRAQGIDLVEKNVIASSTSPLAPKKKAPAPGFVSGGTIYMTDTTLNQGLATAPNTRTTLYLSSDGVTLGHGLAYRNVPQLTTAATSTNTTSGTLPAGLNGTYYVIACADTVNQATESHENNNCSASAPFTISGADLVESSVTVPASTTNGAVAVSDTATNQGPGSAGPSRTNFYISSDGVSQDRAVGFRNVPVLASGASSPGVTNLTLPPGTTGNFYIIACADILSQVPETDETNNCTASSTTFNAPPPDLTESAVSVPATVTGSTLSVTDTVSDTGAAANSSRTTFYLSNDGTTLGVSIGFRNVPGIASGSSSTATTLLTLAKNVQGTWYIMACADSLNTISEGNESNNCTASNSFSSGGPDLTESSVSVTTASPVSGGLISVNDTVTNSGSSAGSSRSLFYLSQDGSTKGVQLAYRDVPGLAGGASSSGTTSLKLPVSINGTYYIIVCANATGAVPETNTANNCAPSGSFTVAGADLVESSVSVPSAASSGTIQVTDTVQNNGPGASGTSRTTFYLSNDGSTIARGLAFRNVGALANAATDSNSTLLTLPSGLSGTYYIIACADTTNAVAEGNETNNCSSSGAFTAP